MATTKMATDPKWRQIETATNYIVVKLYDANDRIDSIQEPLPPTPVLILRCSSVFMMGFHRLWHGIHNVMMIRRNNNTKTSILPKSIAMAHQYKKVDNSQGQ